MSQVDQVIKMEHFMLHLGRMGSQYYCAMSKSFEDTMHNCDDICICKFFSLYQGHVVRGLVDMLWPPKTENVLVLNNDSVFVWVEYVGANTQKYEAAKSITGAAYSKQLVMAGCRTSAGQHGSIVQPIPKFIIKKSLFSIARVAYHRKWRIHHPQSQVVNSSLPHHHHEMTMNWLIR